MDNTSSLRIDRSQSGLRPLRRGVSGRNSMTIAASRGPGLPPRRHGGAWVWALALGVGLLSGCAKKASEASAPEAPMGSMDAAGGEGSVEELERRLVSEENQLRAAGVALPTGSTVALGESPNGGFYSDDSGDAVDPSRPMAEAESVADVGGAGLDRSTSRERRRCTNVCDLSRSICDLEAQICSLAERHVDDRRYSEVCERAGGDCRVAQEACNACT